MVVVSLVEMIYFVMGWLRSTTVSTVHGYAKMRLIKNCHAPTQRNPFRITDLGGIGMGLSKWSIWGCYCKVNGFDA